MNRDDIIRMAREAGKADGTTPLERSIVLYAAKSTLFLEKFASIVAAAEREECAKVMDEMANYMESEMEPSETVAWVRSKAAAIRARGNNAA